MMTVRLNPPPPPADLTSCDREPIHTPGHIQPHGALIATAPGASRITHVSTNTATLLGLPAASLLGTDLAEILGSAGMAAIEQTLRDTSHESSNILNLRLAIPIRPRRHILVHRHQQRLVVEFEGLQRHHETGGAGLSKIQRMVMSLTRTNSVAEVCDRAVQDLRQFHGFDRVMVYRFDADGHGCVIAEDKAPGLAPFLDLHFPASDIPQQARQLYVSQRVRSIPDADYQAVPVISVDGSALDMSFSALRGISPVHLEYMRNMGTRASFSMSLLRDGALWGMIVGHHMKPLSISPATHALFDIIGQLMSVLLQRFEATETLVNRLARTATILAVRTKIDSAATVADGLYAQSDALLDLMGAGGALVRCGGHTRLLGNTPPSEVCDDIAAALLPAQGNTITLLADAGVTGGVAAAYPETASGVLVMPLTDKPGDMIVWFRPEIAQTVQWAGNPTKQVIQSDDGARLLPRKSFAIWTELLRGRSAPWTQIDLNAADELRRSITKAMLYRATTQLAYLSAYDPLTGLANRRTLEANLKRCSLDRATQTGSILFIDLDRFKSLNDTLGHETGDELLIQAAKRIYRMVPANALAARLGGDEFIVFWPGAPPDEPEYLAGRLVEELAHPFSIKDSLYYLGASIGVVTAEAAGFEAMIWQADAAMYAAKRQGGGRVAVYDPALHAGVQSNIKLEQDLFHALERDELTVHYQPIVSLPDGKVTGFEALARWYHPERGWIAPSEFIPRAEQAGLISRIGLIVLKEAVKCLAAWRGAHPGLSMSVNISAPQLLDRSLVSNLPIILAEAGMLPGSLCLEVTESTLMESAAILALTQLRGLGVKVAVDDFGTGHSSLAYLSELPVDIVKIDRSFVTSLGKARADRFFTAIVDLARTLSLRTVAEGCETWEQWNVLDRAGCDMVQGWLVAKAMDAAAALRFLEDSPQWNMTPPVAATLAIRPRAIEASSSGAGQFGKQHRITAEGDELHGKDVFFAAVQMSRAPMTLVDPRLDGAPLVFANEAFEHLTGYSQAEIIGRNCRFLQGPDTDPITSRQIREALAEAKEISVELLNYRKDGSTFWNALRITPVFDDSGHLRYFFGSQIDVTRRNWV